MLVSDAISLSQIQVDTRKTLYNHKHIHTHTVRHTFVVLIVGSSERVTCSLSDTSFVTWENEDDIVLVEGNVLPLSANDSVHEKTYSCRGYLDASRTTLIKELNIKPIITGKYNILYVSIFCCIDNGCEFYIVISQCQILYSMSLHHLMMGLLYWGNSTLLFA